MSNKADNNPRFTIPKFEKFGYYLYDRFHILLKHFLILEEDTPYTIFLNIYDRSLNGESRQLIYAGIDRQRELLNAEGDGMDVEWAFLKNIKLESSKTVESPRLISEFKSGKLGAKDIQIKKLDSYLNVENPAEEQKREIPILIKNGFNENDYFVSFPIIQFGFFEGVAHLVIKEEEVSLTKRNEKVQQEILLLAVKLFTHEYESLIYDWDLSYENIFKESIIDLKVLGSDEFYTRVKDNPIMKELDYQTYYRKSLKYIKERIDQNNEVPHYIKEEHRKRAIIAILIDSYAHNISAHSLTVLNWWFKQRAAEVKASKYFENDEEFQKLVDGTQSAMELINSLGNENVLSKYKAPLAPELQPLLKFLLEKGAFWSGVSRGITFGGEIQNLYDVLWKGFINNALYLGTIANSEQVNKINIHLTFFEDHEEHGELVHTNIKRIKKIDDVQLDGLFAKIDLSEPKLEKEGEEDQSAFVKLGDNYFLFKKALQNKEAFFPGGIIGMHSFFTLLENEIRNVKHFRGNDLREIQDKGLILNISIHERYVNSQKDNKNQAPEIFKIGVWLKHPVALTNRLATKRLNGLWKDIITTDTQQPKLGGSFQDKICAAMLFNNDFTKVQKGSQEEKSRSTARENIYYPYIKAASTAISKITNSIHEDFEISGRKFLEIRDTLKQYYIEERGYLKKYFHLWKGDFILQVGHDYIWDWENVSRFNFVNIPKGDIASYSVARAAGVIRIMENADTSLSREAIYKLWLSKWFKTEDEAIRIRLLRRNTEVGHLIFDKYEGAKYFKKSDYTDEIAEEYGDYDERSITFAHASYDSENDKNFTIRSHGILAEIFFKGVTSIEDFHKAAIEPLPLYELLEVLQTKIAIFDNRVAGRVREDKIADLNDMLRCGIYREELEKWEKVKTNLTEHHFLIMHLSFIEGMLDRNGMRYDEKGVGKFIEEQIIPNVNVAEGNFVLVITTGRGRTKWWEVVQSTGYINFTTFRPVESIIEATEKASLKKDDIDLKYNLIKVLFGS